MGFVNSVTPGHTALCGSASEHCSFGKDTLLLLFVCERGACATECLGGQRASPLLPLGVPASYLAFEACTVYWLGFLLLFCLLFIYLFWLT